MALHRRAITRPAIHAFVAAQTDALAYAWCPMNEVYFWPHTGIAIEPCPNRLCMWINFNVICSLGARFAWDKHLKEIILCIYILVSSQISSYQNDLHLSRRISNTKKKSIIDVYVQTPLCIIDTTFESSHARIHPFRNNCKKCLPIILFVLNTINKDHLFIY